MLLRVFQKLLPVISKTEKIALRCGTLSIDRHLFENNVHQHLPQYKLHLTDKEQAFLDKETHQLCASRYPVRDHALSSLDMKQIKNDFLGLCIPETYRGKQFSSYAHSRIVQKIASACISTAVTVMVPNSLGPAELLLKYGTPEQKDLYLKKLATGKMIPCFGLTGPQNGSDALGHLDKGRLVDSSTIQFECNKRWITLAPIADLVGLALDIEGHGPTVLLLERDEVPWKIGNRHHPIGSTFMNGTIRTEGPVWVSTDKVLGGSGNLGKGWEMLMESLSEGRGISLPALAVGVGCVLSLQTSYYARARTQFKIPLSEMQGVQEKLGKIVANTYTTLAMHELFNATLLRHEKSSVLSAILKYRTTELARESVIHAMDIFAGKGISLGPKNPVASIYSQIPIAITVEGSNTLTRSLIIFAQGINKSHPYVGDMVEALEKEDSTTFFRLLPRMVGYVLYHYGRSWMPASGLDQRLDRRHSLYLFLASLMLFKGKGLKKNQMQTGRMADLLTLLYTAYALRWFNQHRAVENALLEHVLWDVDRLLTDVCREEGFLTSLMAMPWVRANPLADRDWIHLSQAVLRDPSIDALLVKYVYLHPEDPLVKFRECWKQGKEPSQELLSQIIEVDSTRNV